MRRICVGGDFHCRGLAATAWPNPRASTSPQFSALSDRFQRANRATHFRYARTILTVNRAKKGCADHNVGRTGGGSWL
jgi:hypothetical protein